MNWLKYLPFNIQFLASASINSSTLFNHHIPNIKCTTTMSFICYVYSNFNLSYDKFYCTVMILINRWIFCYRTIEHISGYKLQRMFLFSFPWPSIIFPIFILLYSLSIRHCKRMFLLVGSVDQIEQTFGKIQGPQVRELVQDRWSVLWSVLQRVPEHHH